MLRKMVTFSLITLINGCASNNVAPVLLSNPNVKPVVGAQGYPVLDVIRFERHKPSTLEQASQCIKASVDGLEAAPILIAQNVQASGTSSFEPPPPSIGKPFRFTLTASTGTSTVFTFERIRYTNAGPIGAIEGIGAENAYEVMRDIADRIERCLPLAST